MARISCALRGWLRLVETVRKILNKKSRFVRRALERQPLSEYPACRVSDVLPHIRWKTPQHNCEMQRKGGECAGTIGVAEAHAHATQNSRNGEYTLVGTRQNLSGRSAIWPGACKTSTLKRWRGVQSPAHGPLTQSSAKNVLTR